VESAGQPSEPIVVRNQGETIVYARGDIDLANCDQLRTAIEPELGPNVTIVIDLSEVTYMDSTCLNVLLHAQLRQDELGGAFAIQHPSPTAERLLTLTGLEHLIRA
jgi:anti-anti-sigma factor